MPSGAQSARLPSILHLLGFFILFPRKRAQLACHQELSLLVCNIIPISATPHLCLCPPSLPAKLSLLPLFLFYKNIYGLLSACFYPRSTLTVPSQPLSVLVQYISSPLSAPRSILNTLAELRRLLSFSALLSTVTLPYHYRLTPYQNHAPFMFFVSFFMSSCVLLYVFLCSLFCVLFVVFFMLLNTFFHICRFLFVTFVFFSYLCRLFL